ncbi:hypothetical protein DUNSADRAFT_84 [Dunaliella salina]|uniref:Uncharacterized protein n=1 Tax=Dunaliella salina TaxID=3046 RepID=A0ABQ7H8V0_DUNSA|nr:hypothetical protein DUNSADRAFT_84 [Dunaliella salina]|eukprot:KAF5843282.1 hypothetical protein DUNSADRAFT_84 [Dunaliella salina]
MLVSQSNEIQLIGFLSHCMQAHFVSSNIEVEIPKHLMIYGRPRIVAACWCSQIWSTDSRQEKLFLALLHIPCNFSGCVGSFGDGL